MSRPKSPTQPMPKLSEFVVNGKPTKLCWDYITKLSNAVIIKFFSKYLSNFDKHDLIQLAIEDAVAFAVKISKTQKDEDIINIRNVFFTRIRNSVSNFVFRSNRLVSTDDEILNTVSVAPKANSLKSDLIDLYDLSIDSIDSFRTISLNTWQLFKANSTLKKYTINSNNDDLKDWETYSEIKNMKTPCDLINLYDMYTDDEIEALATKLDKVTGQNYFNTLYQLLGDKFLAFLDVFQEDKFNIPSTSVVKNILTDISICEDYDDGLSVKNIMDKYDKSEISVNRILEYRDVI